MPVFTIGHSTCSIEKFIGLLRMAEITCVLDVRRFPHSKRQPQFDIKTLPASLAKADIGYIHMPDLGGRRAQQKGAPSSHTFWRESGFRNYSDYAETPKFHAAFDRLLKLARKNKTLALMCAEALWWQCHRRIIADYLLAAGIEVEHILNNRLETAKLTEGAYIRPDGAILYSGEPLFRSIG